MVVVSHHRRSSSGSPPKKSCCCTPPGLRWAGWAVKVVSSGWSAGKQLLVTRSRCSRPAPPLLGNRWLRSRTERPDATRLGVGGARALADGAQRAGQLLADGLKLDAARVERSPQHAVVRRHIRCRALHLHKGSRCERRREESKLTVGARTEDGVAEGNCERYSAACCSSTRFARRSAA